MITTHEPRQRRWILAALMLTMALAAMDTTIVSTAIPQIVGDLGGFTLFSWVFSIYLLAQTVTIPIYGKLADSFGRKPVLSSTASALAWSMPNGARARHGAAHPAEVSEGSRTASGGGERRASPPSE